MDENSVAAQVSLGTGGLSWALPWYSALGIFSKQEPLKRYEQKQNKQRMNEDFKIPYLK